MFIGNSKTIILDLEKRKQAEFIALWDCIENAISFYAEKQGFYTAYVETIEDLEYAYATPVKVYKIFSYSSSALDIR